MANKKTKKELEEENKKLKRDEEVKQWIQIIGTLVVFLILIFGLAKITSNKYSTLEPFSEIEIQEIKCVANNSILYTKIGCGHCYDQKQILGDYVDEFMIVDCSEKENLDKCSEINGVPTWKINGEYHIGKKTLDKLKELTDCYQEGEEEITKQKIIEDCSNLSLKRTARCLRNNIKVFYKYNVTDDRYAKNITIKEITEIGTDCGGYSYLYEKLAEGIGYDALTIRIAGKGVAHRTMIINNREGFCIINMLHIECFMYK